MHPVTQPHSTTTEHHSQATTYVSQPVPIHPPYHPMLHRFGSQPECSQSVAGDSHPGRLPESIDAPICLWEILQTEECDVNHVVELFMASGSSASGSDGEVDGVIDGEGYGDDNRDWQQWFASDDVKGGVLCPKLVYRARLKELE